MATMATIIIKTQAELNALPKSFEKYTIIEIRNDPANGRIILQGAYDNASVEAHGNASVRAYGNAFVEAHGNASVVAYDNASVVAYDNASVEVSGNASVRAYDNASVGAYDNASVRAFNQVAVRSYSLNVKIKLNDMAVHWEMIGKTIRSARTANL